MGKDIRKVTYVDRDLAESIEEAAEKHYDGKESVLIRQATRRELQRLKGENDE